MSFTVANVRDIYATRSDAVSSALLNRSESFMPSTSQIAMSSRMVNDPSRSSMRFFQVGRDMPAAVNNRTSGVRR